ncbi:isochorismate synthase [Rhizobium sp. FKL33]|uniref:isochorismate synthase n=1 Tax=Rhizobium sp. FKL33 TaxID=2562307 RepID=UPI0010C0DD54|nr:isochorismate synthase [Rhizobium sp. FKL33]
MSSISRKTIPSSLPQSEETPLFAFRSRRGNIAGFGRKADVTRGSVATIEARLADFFHRAGPDAVVAGALPFARGAADYLWQADHTRSGTFFGRQASLPQSNWRLRQEPSAEAYADAVRRALAIMAEEAGHPDALAKIVLARTLVAKAAQPIDVTAVLGRLSTDPATTAFLVPLPDRNQMPRALVGATPELLLSKSGARISSHPLAGSAKRQPSLAADAKAATTLGRSEKDHREHRLVVEFILDTLAPYCHRLLLPEGATVTCTNSMWHLGTRIEGELKDAAMPVAVLAAALHPTPAVCGVPRERAAGIITELEPHDRDFYAGAVGWCDGRGDGAWYVTIRCAELSGDEARLYAGAGIVPGSDPQAEAEETGAKFGAMLAALGIRLEGGRA